MTCMNLMYSYQCGTLVAYRWADVDSKSKLIFENRPMYKNVCFRLFKRNH